jgi:hypothetical protein
VQLVTRGHQDNFDIGEDPDVRIDHLILVVSGPVAEEPNLYRLGYRVSSDQVRMLP